MGVPAFFAWLSKKYPSIVIYAKEEVPKTVGDTSVKIPIDLTAPNPNGFEFDNLYLDMNGIIHPCTHPENKPAPKNEEEMFIAIFEYIDRLMSIIRPRKLLYMAVDGVAPRAKMNQQRSRRFRSAKESQEKNLSIEKIRNELENRGAVLPPRKKDHFDSNCITPGTPFMARLSTALGFYIYERLNNNPGWKDIQVILSDASVPGEGEHKIMNFIRRQRASPSHDANTRHCLCGADADLIMLGLATHEVNFTIIREEFKPNTPRPCEICGQYGHEMVDCVGGEQQQDSTIVSNAEADFIFINLAILRQYLEIDLKLNAVNMEWDFERALDDWVFMCFFVGNDFLPHLPSLEIRENAIDKLISIYSKCIKESSTWLTDSGDVNFEQVLNIIKDLGDMEDDIFQRRRSSELQFRARNAKNERYSNRNSNQHEQSQSHRAQRPDLIKRSNEVEKAERNLNNMEAAVNLKHILTPLDPVPKKKSRIEQECGQDGDTKKDDEKVDEMAGLTEHEKQDKQDQVRLWEQGFKDRYYTSKFSVDVNVYPDFPQTVAYEYAKGLCWVLAYYYQGCVSWNWYYPYHYAPFASDFAKIDTLDIKFTEKTQPFKPLQQLMSVFPAASGSHVPPSWQDLMTDPLSPIIDFYPIDFRIDLNGKRHAWMGVALLPFVEERRLLKALNDRLDRLEPEEVERNKRGSDKYFVHQDHKVAKFIISCYEDFGALNLVADEDYEEFPEKSKIIPVEFTHGLAGIVWTQDGGIIYKPDEVVPSPFINSCPSIAANHQKVIGCCYYDPEYSRSFKFPAKILTNAKMPEKVHLKPPLRGRGNFVGMRGSRGDDPGHRMIDNHLGRDNNRNQRYDNNYRRGEGRGGYDRDHYRDYSNDSRDHRQQYNNYNSYDRREQYNSYCNDYRSNGYDNQGNNNGRGGYRNNYNNRGRRGGGRNYY